MIAAVIGAATLIFAHSTLDGILVGIVFLGVAGYLFWKPSAHGMA